MTTDQQTPPPPVELPNGIATSLPPGGAASHFRANRLSVGNVVMSVNTHVAAATAMPERLRIRVFDATADSRLRLHRMDPDSLLTSTGGLGFVEVDLSNRHSDGTVGGWQRMARLTEFRIAGDTAADRGRLALAGLGDWMLQSLEWELLTGSWLGLQGSARCFDAGSLTADGSWSELQPTSDLGAWAADWLAGHGYAVDDSDPGAFFKVLNPATLAGVRAGHLS